MIRLREDVHIHAPAAEVHERLSTLDTYRDWLPRAFRGVTGRDGEISFELVLPLRRERAHLRAAIVEPPTLLVMEAAGGDGSLASLTWALHSEAAGEVHITLEAEYSPAGGIAALLEPILFQPRRRQAFRDALWAFKRFVERRGGDDGGPPS